MEIPTEFERLLDDDWREAAVEGGRFSLKSHTVARILLIRARQSKKRILCARELQNSIADSSHQLLADLIRAYDLTDFTVTNNAIVNTVNNSDFLFKGLAHNEQSIKSTEGIDIAWVEEAQSVSEKSIEILTPTVRKDGSQIIYTYNRTEEEDPVHKRIVIDGRPNTLHIHVDFNIALKYKLMPDVLIAEMEDDKKRRPDLFKHKWLGMPLQLTEERIYTGWNIIDDVPHEARLERYGLDFGWSPDPAALVAIYYYNGGYILDEVGCQLEWSNREIAGTLKNLPKAMVVADSAEPKSIAEIKMYGINIVATPKGQDYKRFAIKNVQDQRISVTKQSVNIIKEYRNYLWDTDKDGKIIPGKPADGNDHCFIGSTKVQTKQGEQSIKSIKEGEEVLTSKGFRKVLIRHNNGLKKVSEYWLHLDTHSVRMICTNDHKIKTGDTWTPISQLKPGQTVSYIKPIKEKNTISTQGNGTSQNITKDYTGLSMKTLTGSSLLGSMCTTLMATLTTITHLISSYSKGKNTNRAIVKRIESFSERLFNQWEQGVQKHGIPPMRALSGIANTVNEPGIIDHTKNTYAKYVRNYLSPVMVEKQDFVIKTAVLVGLEERRNWKEEVYDLTVEDTHEYFANGILVHNCLDAILYGINSLIPIQRRRELYPQMAQRRERKQIAL